MEVPSTPSLAGPSRRSRRLQEPTETPGSIPRVATGYGHRGAATSAAGSPYSRRPAFTRDPSSRTLADAEAGELGSFQTPENTRTIPIPASASALIGTASKKDVANRRRSMGPEGLLRSVVRKSLGWLVGRTSTDAADETEELADEESGIGELGRLRTSATSFDISRLNHHSTTPLPPPASKPARAPSPSALSIASRTDLDEDASPRKFRTSHSTLNLSSQASGPSALTRYSPAPIASTSGSMRRASPIRHQSPSRLGSGLPASKSSIFARSSLSLAPGSSLANGSAAAVPRSVSPGGQSQISRPHSATSSAFGLTSQSPFRAAGHTARSPDITSLNISSGLARSPSLPRDRLAIQQQQSSRLYPYHKRSPSILSNASRAAGTLPVSYSVADGLAGTKRGFNAISASPPKLSPIHASFFRAGGITASPTSTDFGSDVAHRQKRQRLSVVWDPEKGFVTTDVQGGHAIQSLEPSEAPKNEAERILERLESLRRPQVDGLRTSPKRINVPLPASAAPSDDSIIAKRITASQSVPSFSATALSPYARRQRAAREEEAAKRDRLKATGGLGERMRQAQMEKDKLAKRSQKDVPRDSEDELEILESETERRAARHRQRHQRDEEGLDEDDDVAELPQPNKRRTRQRTRELSVLSDASEMEQDQVASPRRSTRNKGKAKEPAVSDTPKQRRPKSAKSPEATSTTSRKSAADGKKGGKRTVVSDEDEVADGVETRSGRRLRSPTPASPPPTKSKKRAVSPPTKADAAKAAPSIGQVMNAAPASTHSPVVSASPTMRPGRTHRSHQREPAVTLGSKRPVNGFSARDDDEDDGAPIETDSGITRSDSMELAKLKLPSSIFANRFSFGKAAPPRSPSVAPQSPSVVEPAAGEKSLASRLGEKVEVPKVSPIPSPAPVSTPSFSLSPSASASPAPIPTQPEVPAPKAMFSFTPPQPVACPATTLTSKADQVEAAPKVAEASKSSFSFTAPASATSGSAEASSVSSSAPKFSFGAAPAAAEAKSAPTFSFGAKPEEKAAVAAPAFSFGQTDNTSKASTPSSEVPAIAPSTSSTRNPFAAFPTAKSTPVSTPPAEGAATTPTFSFGANKTDTASGSSSAPSFTFGQAAQPSKPAEPSTPSASIPAFSFKPATPVTSTTPSVTEIGPSASSAAPDSMHDSPPPPAAPPTSTAGPFSPVVAPSKAPAFSFGAPAPAATASPSPSASPAPAFTFGQPATAAAITSRASTPFGTPPTSSAGPTAPFAFGASSGSAHTSAAPKPAFSFGAPAPSTNTTNGNGTSLTPTFGFGQSASSTPAATSNAFGAPPTSTGPPAFGGFGSSQPSDSKPSFTFGSTPPAAAAPAASGTPSFTFGAPAANGANGSTTPGTSGPPAFTFGGGSSGGAPPSFSFGGASSSAPSSNPFAFGASAPPPTNNGAPAFSFGGGVGGGGGGGGTLGAPSGPPTPGLQGGGGLFSIGSGGDANSPNKAKRQIKPLRRGRT